MEQTQTPADARAAPSASGPTDMATETPPPPSPKRPRDPSSDNKVNQRATSFDPPTSINLSTILNYPPSTRPVPTPYTRAPPSKDERYTTLVMAKAYK
eukprot:scaffold23376_cov124-Isochrysis_galbana.AAC.1